MSSRDHYENYSEHYRRVGNALPSKTIFLPDVKGDFHKDWMSGLPKDAAILDCGCGSGHQLYALALLGFTQLYGIDIVKGSVEIAKRELGEKAQIELGDAFDYLAARNNTFDVIIVNDVLEHIPRERTIEFLEAIRRALKAGGVVHVRVPNMSSLLSNFSMYIDITHLVGYTEFSLFQVLELAGFEDIKLHSGFPVATWRPRRPWKMFKRFGLQLVFTANIVLHKLLYLLRAQEPKPREFGINVEVYACKR